MKKLSIFFLSVFVMAQAPPSFKLKEVRVEGNVATSQNMVLYTAGLKDGQEVSTEDFRRAVKRLWELGVFSNIQIHFDGETPEGILISIEVEESPVLGEVIFNGNKKIKDKKFKSELAYQRGMRIKPNFITKTIKKMKGMYKEKGYFLVGIEGEMKPSVVVSEEGKKDVVFTIKEGKKVKIKDIQIRGNANNFGWIASKSWIPLPQFLRKNLSLNKLRWQLKETKIRTWWRLWAAAFDEKKFEEDLEALATFYRDEGYRDFTILSDSIYYEPKKKGLVVHINVDEGNRYKYQDVTWEGHTLYETEDLVNVLNLEKGDYFSQSSFQEAFQGVQSLYMDRGYLYVNIEPFFTPVGEDSVNIHFSITENNQVYIRHINISGNEKTRENVIRRELDIFPGDLFRRALMERSIRKLHVLNYFDPTSLSPNVIPIDEDEIDLDITLQEKSSDKASANIGFTGIYGMTGGANVEFNNFQGRGQVLSVGFEVGTQMSVMNNYGTPGKYESFNIRFMDPMFRDTPNRIGFSIFYTFRGQGNSYYFYPFDQRSRGASIQWGRRLKWPDDYFRAYWEMTVRKAEYMGDDEILNQYIGSFRESTGISLKQSISRDSRDRAEFPTQGSRATWESTFSGGILGGDENYHKHVLTLDWYTPTFWKFVLTSSLKVGTIRMLNTGGDNFAYIPPYERFIMGGNGIPYGTMLRGYPDNAVGPTTSQGRSIGGNTMLKYTTEFRVPFSENPVVYGMLFAEAGGVWNDTRLMQSLGFPRRYPLELKRSAGIGIRFFMPMIGQLGFDMGYGFDDITGDGNPQGWEYTIIFGR